MVVKPDNLHIHSTALVRISRRLLYVLAHASPFRMSRAVLLHMVPDVESCAI